jgi:glucans biosynthesis protein
VAIDTVEPSGEEFPHFTDFWLEKPAAAATHLVILALMEGPSIAGAYRFDITPGAQTVVDVQTRLFARKPIKKLGIAALTSMFFFGENTRRKFDDFRPEVHDSDGLLLNFENGEWLWRPLDNPLRISASGLQMHNPRGFGLLQRDRDFTSHQDLETRAELRPSAWVTPRGDCGDGRVEVVELPTDTEKNDNIVAYWVPAAPVTAGKRMNYDYSVSFYSDDASRPPAGRVVATRQDSGVDNVGHRFVVDFAGGRLASMTGEPTAVISLGNRDAAELLDHHVVKNPETGGWRLTFQLKRKLDVPIELRAFLKDKTEVVTETWSYAAEK